MRIRSVNAKFGGSCHDSHVWNLSAGRRFLEASFRNGNKSSWLIGKFIVALIQAFLIFWITADSGYPLEPWLLTPYRVSTEDSREAVFNLKLSKARNIIERTFCVLKGRFFVPYIIFAWTLKYQ